MSDIVVAERDTNAEADLPTDGPVVGPDDSGILTFDDGGPA